MADLRAETAALGRRARDAVRLSALIGESVALRRQGREFAGLCPFHGERTPSFTVNDDKGFFHCFGCGAHGDALGWMMQYHRLAFPEAVAHLAARAGLARPSAGAPLRALPPLPPPPPPVDAAAEAARKLARAREIWREAGAADLPGSLVPVYLRARGIVLPPPPTLRFAPALRHTPSGRMLPAMVAMVIAAGERAGDDPAAPRMIGIHRTYLRPDGAGKAAVANPKRMLGGAWGGAIRLAPAGPVLLIGEGIETTLAAMQATGLPGWAAGSLNNLAGPGRGQGQPHPTRAAARLPSPEPDMDRPGMALPPEVREVVLLADADGDRPTAEALLARAAARRRREGRRARIAWPPDGTDFNDLLRGAA